MHVHSNQSAIVRKYGVQFETLFTDELYHEIARGAVQKAIRLKKSVVRFVTGWTTTDDEIDQLIAYIR